MNQATSIDWIRFTLPYGFQDNGSEKPSFIGGETEACKPILSYNMAVKNDQHLLCWHTDHPEFRVLVEMTGSQLSAARRAGSTEAGIIAEATRLGANFTRIDFAVDLFDCDAVPLDVLECWRTDQLITSALSVSLVQKETRKGRTGQTVYVGARSSERLVRIYDKGAQSKTKLDWTRVEMEIKGKRARQFGMLLERDGTDMAGKSYLRDVIEWTDIKWFESMWGDDFEVIDIDKIGRPETDRERWLRTVVVPVIEDELESGSEWLFDALQAIMSAYEEKRGHGPNISPTWGV